MVAQTVKKLSEISEMGFNSWARKIPWSREGLPKAIENV